MKTKSTFVVCLDRSSRLAVGAVVGSMLAALVQLSPGVALAQPAVPPPPPPTGPAAPAAAPAREADGARFRGGISGAFGGIFGSSDPISYSGFLGGVDGRMGVQINNLIGVYADPHLSFGSISQTLTLGASEVSASEGWLDVAATGVVDVTLVDRFFVGAGAGVAAHAPTCTNCNGLAGAVLHFRLGGYPIMSRGDDGIRRKGLTIGGDLRVNFLSGTGGYSITMIQPMVTLGYEAF